jgi:hypothetical protein
MIKDVIIPDRCEAEMPSAVWQHTGFVAFFGQKQKSISPALFF